MVDITCYLASYKNVVHIHLPIWVTMGTMKWLATYIQYFALGMQLPPAPSHRFLFTWSAVRLKITPSGRSITPQSSFLLPSKN